MFKDTSAKDSRKNLGLGEKKRCVRARGVLWSKPGLYPKSALDQTRPIPNQPKTQPTLSTGPRKDPNHDAGHLLIVQALETSAFSCAALAKCNCCMIDASASLLTPFAPASALNRRRLLLGPEVAEEDDAIAQKAGSRRVRRTARTNGARIASDVALHTGQRR